MFNDLNNSNSSGHAAVDDIFAETDKTSNGNQSEIETHRVGLAVSDGSVPMVDNDMNISSEPVMPKTNYLKIIIIVLLSLAFLGGVYFTYSQFFKSDSSDVASTTVKVTTQSPKATTAKAVENNFVAAIPGSVSTTSLDEAITASSTNSSELVATSTIDLNSSSTVNSTIDSDNDGLTDAEEKIAGTNPNVIDTDNDGLSDYEEVKIYHTNPLVADTDGDGYTDGAEVKSGYNPNGPGKLPGNTVTK